MAIGMVSFRCLQHDNECGFQEKVTTCRLLIAVMLTA